MIRMQPFCVIGHEAQPCRACFANQLMAESCDAWSESSNAISTLTSNKERTVFRVRRSRAGLRRDDTHERGLDGDG